MSNETGRSSLVARTKQFLEDHGRPLTVFHIARNENFSPLAELNRKQLAKLIFKISV